MAVNGVREAVICGYVRTPIGRFQGVLANSRPDDLAAHALKVLVERTGIDPADVDDVLLGNVNQAGEDNRNVARMAALLADFPVTVPGQTLNRLCASGLQAMNSAAQAIWSGQGEMFIAGGVESMTRAPWVTMKPDSGFMRGVPETADTVIGWRFTNPKLLAAKHDASMGETAENVAERRGVARKDQDAFALLSQQKYGRAVDKNRYQKEIIPIDVPGKKRGETMTIQTDEHPRPETTLEQLEKLRPAFTKDGSVTAGNSSGINDGAAALLVTTPERAKALGLTPLARIVSTAVAGVRPDEMGLGPIPASRKALERAGLSIDDMGIVELNEAFASQVIACLEELGVDWRDETRVNPNGGAIAIGHPLGASGARLAGTTALNLSEGLNNSRYGLVTMCIGVGQGAATVLERWED
jgi:3-oxoadipyl-CoA thiolase